jgi:hypothetical protein
MYVLDDEGLYEGLTYVVRVVEYGGCAWPSPDRCRLMAPKALTKRRASIQVKKTVEYLLDGQFRV